MVHTQGTPQENCSQTMACKGGDKSPHAEHPTRESGFRAVHPTRKWFPRRERLKKMIQKNLENKHPKGYQNCDSRVAPACPPNNPRMSPKQSQNRQRRMDAEWLQISSRKAQE